MKRENRDLGRREFLKLAAGGAAATLGLPASMPESFAQESRVPTGPGRSRPNIVLIVSDDHGRDALGCYGNRVVRTPALDALAKDGVRFTSAFCAVSSCSPSRSVILTGMHNHANGQYGLQHDMHHFSTFDTVKSFPPMLSAAGYRTARAGKFHIAPESVYRFDEVLYDGAANDINSLARNPVRMAEMCKEFLTRADRPFFLYFCLDDPHRGTPYTTWPEPNRFGNRDAGYPGVDTTPYRPEDVLVPPSLPDTVGTRKELAEYYQAVTRADQGVGRLLELLKTTGRYENTLIFYISDNGMAFPGAKTTLYDPGIHLPCLVHLPGNARRSAVSDAMISWCDLAPTILDFAGALPEHPTFHGRSFRKVLEGEQESGWDEVYASHTSHGVTEYYPMRAVRGRRYKLIHNLVPGQPFPMAKDLKGSLTWQECARSGGTLFGQRAIRDLLSRPEYELYDLSEDPLELRNIADARRQVLEEYREKLGAFRRRTNDPWYDAGS